MKGYRRKPRRGTVHREVWGMQDRSKRMDRNKGKASAKTKGERDTRGVKRRSRHGNVFGRPNGQRENSETAISGRGPGLARRRKRYASNRQEEEDVQMCPCGKAVALWQSSRVELT